jgi:glutaminyl-peptide cyclotransferase
MSTLRSLVLLAVIVACTATYSREQPSQSYQANQKVKFRIVGKFPRANGQLFFTEGLSFANKDTLMESCGLYGDSEIHFIEKFDQGEASLSNRHQLSKEFFGEGSDTIDTPDGLEHYMMTYKERKVFVFDETLENVKREYEMPKVIKEGWGLTHYKNGDKQMLLVSDGTNRIFHVDPSDFSVQKTVEVLDFNRMELD